MTCIRCAIAIVAAIIIASVAAPQAASAALNPRDPTTNQGKLTASTTYATLNNDVYTIACNTLSFSLSFASSGAVVMTALSAASCETIFGISCSFTTDVATLGDSTTAGGTIVHSGSGAGVLTLGTNATITFNFTCAGVTCVYNLDTTNAGSMTSGDPADLTVFTGFTTASGGDCTNGSLLATLDIDSVDAGTGTPTPDDTKFTIS